MALPMTVTDVVTKTNTGKSISIGGVIGVATLIADALKDHVLEPTEIGTVVTAIFALFGVIHLRRAIGPRLQ